MSDKDNNELINHRNDDIESQAINESSAEIETKNGLNKKDVAVGVSSGIALLASAFALYQKHKAHKLNKELEKARLQNKQYQALILKHQAEINAIKDELDRQEYKNRLWEEVQTLSED